MEIAVLANVTSRLRIGPLVSPVTLRQPVDLTPQAIALNVLNNGRIELVIAELLGI
jgi:alkanesulfonate monooxygenase SsuD/methylene tetrahydromethanopterin reductase-like flavin-dependent oxidoreductase (luciferase family)